jgi:hypothetical protein
VRASRKRDRDGDDLGRGHQSDSRIAEEVTLVVMEATSDYWKPFYYLLEDGPCS